MGSTGSHAARPGGLLGNNRSSLKAEHQRSPMSGTPSDPDLIKVTELLLVPSSFLVAALGTADTNGHRAAVSLLGLAVSLLWWAGVHDAYRHAVQPIPGSPDPLQPPLRTRILYWLPLVFAFGWLISLIVHSLLWTHPLGFN
jgi:hypothetical protein